MYVALDSLPNKKTPTATLAETKRQNLLTGPVYDSLTVWRQLRQYDLLHAQSRSLVCLFVNWVEVGLGSHYSYKQFQLLEVQVKANISKP
jgi:hypothetical protein